MNHISRISQYIVDQFEMNPLVNTIAFEKTSEMDYNKSNIYPLVNIDIINSRIEDNLIHINYTFTIVEGRDVDNESNNDKLFGSNLIDNLNETHAIGLKFINYFTNLNNQQEIDIDIDTNPELRFVKLKDGALDGVQFDMEFTMDNDMASCNSTSDVYEDTYSNENDYFKIYSNKGIILMDSTGEAMRTSLGEVYVPSLTASADTYNNIGVDEFGKLISIPIETTTAGDIKIAVVNKTGVSIPKGSAVYINGAQGSRATIALALADTNLTTSLAIGLTSDVIPNNGNGYVVIIGEISKIDTSNFTNGDRVYISPTIEGGLTNVVPTSPNNVIFVGTVTNSHSTQGKIVINVVYTTKLDRLIDVAITTPTNNQALMFDSGSGLWKNGSVTISGPVPTSATASGKAGDIKFDAGYLYICIATNQWKRSPLSSW